MLYASALYRKPWKDQLGLKHSWPESFNLLFKSSDLPSGLPQRNYLLHQRCFVILMLAHNGRGKYFLSLCRHFLGYLKTISILVFSSLNYIDFYLWPLILLTPCFLWLIWSSLNWPLRPCWVSNGRLPWVFADNTLVHISEYESSYLQEFSHNITT